MGLKETILGADDRRTKEVPIPEWKTTVTIRSISSGERDNIEMQAIQAKQLGKRLENIRAKIAAMIIIDENGNRVFTDEDIPALAAKSSSAVERIFDAHVQLNKMSEEEAAEYEKNS